MSDRVCRSLKFDGGFRGDVSGLVARPVFKTAMESPSGAPVGSIPTRSRHHLFRSLFLLSLFLGSTAPLAAQNGGVPDSVPTDTLRRKPISGTKAFLMSLAIPGWGQASLDRKLTAALFIAVEGVSLGMTVRTTQEIKYFSRIGADTGRVNGKKRQRQDWLILMAFNHLFSGLEAFVSTNLYDFPEDLRIRATPLPNGRIGIGASVRPRRR